MLKDKERGFSTLLSHGSRPGGAERQVFVNPPLHRGSSVLFPSWEKRAEVRSDPLDQRLIYGAQGNETHHALEDMVAAIEGGTRCQIVSTGLAAITTALLAYLKSGDHCLLPDSVYGPGRRFCETLGKGLGIETTYYAPTARPAEVEALLRPNTTLVYAESPGSHTMEVQDVGMLAELAHAHGAKLLLDNTWGVHFFQPFAHGVDCSIQAATKYLAGHSDVLLGTLVVNDDEEWARVRRASVTLGQYASPDDCWLTLRGIRTLALRLERHMKSGLEVAAWLRERPEVIEVLHPGLPGSRGHELWKRDFTGACGLFSVVFDPRFSAADVEALAGELRLFGLGASWGGFESLVLPSHDSLTRVTQQSLGGQLCRFHIGLEEIGDLLADLERGLDAMSRRAGARASLAS